MGKAKADSRSEAASHVAPLLSETEATYQRLEKVRGGYRSLPELQTQSGYAAMYAKWHELGKESRSIIKCARALIAPARDCCLAVDFWHPREQLLLPEFEDTLELFPEQPDGMQSVYPFLRSLRALLLRAATAVAADEPARTQPADRVAEPERDQPAPRPRSTATAAAGASPMLLDERQAAATLKLSVQLLRRWRHDGGGPRFTKLGKCVRYSTAELDRFIRSGQSGQSAPTADGVSLGSTVQ